MCYLDGTIRIRDTNLVSLSLFDLFASIQRKAVSLVCMGFEESAGICKVRQVVLEGIY